MNDELENIVQAAARAVPGMPQTGLDEISRRGTFRRRRRNISMSATAALVLAIAVAVPFALSGMAGRLPIATPSPTPHVPTPAEPQRMLVSGAYLIESDDPETTYGRYPDSGELLPNGTTHRPPEPKGSSPYNLGWRFAPNGGYIFSDIITERVNGEDGPCNPAKNPIVLQDANGKETFRTDAKKECQSLWLLGADERNAYLLREQTVFALSFADKKELKLFDVGEQYRIGMQGSTILNLKTVQGVRYCQSVEINQYDVATGERSIRIVKPKICTHGPERGQISSDGRHMAISLDISYAEGKVRTDAGLIIVDLVTGAIVHEQDFGAKNPDVRIAGLAWMDNSTLKVATYKQETFKQSETGRAKLMDVIQFAEFKV